MFRIYLERHAAASLDYHGAGTNVVDGVERPVVGTGREVGSHFALFYAELDLRFERNAARGERGREIGIGRGVSMS
jgi:urease beta subunit